MRVPFDKIFAEVDGRLVPRMHISIGNVAMAAGVPISPTLVISGITVGKLTGHDLVVEMEEGITMIEGYHQEEPPFAV